MIQTTIAPTAFSPNAKAASCQFCRDIVPPEWMARRVNHCVLRLSWHFLTIQFVPPRFGCGFRVRVSRQRQMVVLARGSARAGAARAQSATQSPRLTVPPFKEVLC